MGRLTNIERQKRDKRAKSKADKEIITAIFHNNPHFTIKQLGQLVDRSEYFASQAVSAWLLQRRLNAQK